MIQLLAAQQRAAAVVKLGSITPAGRADGHAHMYAPCLLLLLLLYAAAFQSMSRGLQVACHGTCGDVTS